MNVFLIYRRLAVQGRPLPTADVSYPVAQLEGQLSGGEIARPTGAGRPGTADRAVERLARNQSAASCTESTTFVHKQCEGWWSLVVPVVRFVLSFLFIFGSV